MAAKSAQSLGSPFCSFGGWLPTPYAVPGCWTANECQRASSSSRKGGLEREDLAALKGTEIARGRRVPRHKGTKARRRVKRGGVIHTTLRAGVDRSLWAAGDNQGCAGSRQQIGAVEEGRGNTAALEWGWEAGRHLQRCRRSNRSSRSRGSKGSRGSDGCCRLHREEVGGCWRQHREKVGVLLLLSMAGSDRVSLDIALGSGAWTYSGTISS